MVTEGHVVEKDEDVEHVFTTCCKVAIIHDAISFLQKVQSAAVLGLFDKCDRTFVELGDNYRYFILLNFERLIIMLLKELILLHELIPLILGNLIE